MLFNNYIKVKSCKYYRRRFIKFYWENKNWRVGKMFNLCLKVFNILGIELIILIKLFRIFKK